MTAPILIAETRPCGGSRPERAASRNAPGIGEGGHVPAQGYSVAAEAPQDSGNRTGRRNEEVGRDDAGASAEPIRTLGHLVLRLAAVVAAVLVTAAILGGLALKAAASRGDLHVMQWGGER